jgi:hypothetical protein
LQTRMNDEELNVEALQPRLFDAPGIALGQS